MMLLILSNKNKIIKGEHPQSRFGNDQSVDEITDIQCDLMHNRSNHGELLVHTQFLLNMHYVQYVLCQWREQQINKIITVS